MGLPSSIRRSFMGPCGLVLGLSVLAQLRTSCWPILSQASALNQSATAMEEAGSPERLPSTRFMSEGLLCNHLLESLKWRDFPVPTGNYEVSIKFNDEHIPESPYLVPVIAPSDDARRLTVMSLQVRRKEASISLAPGQPVRPWTPEAASIPLRTEGPTPFGPQMLPVVGGLSWLESTPHTFRPAGSWGWAKQSQPIKHLSVWGLVYF